MIQLAIGIAAFLFLAYVAIVVACLAFSAISAIYHTLFD